VKQTDQDELLARYLLGQLPEAEETRLEVEYLADAECQERLAVVENELVDAYVRDQLARGERQQLEERFLASPRGRQKLELARSLRALAAQARATPKAKIRRVPRRWLGFAAAAAMAALLALVALERGPWRRPREALRADGPAQPQPPTLPTVAEQPRTPPAPGPAAPAPGPPAPAPGPPAPAQPMLAFAVLKPGTTRDLSALKRVHIPEGATELTLELDLDSDRHAAYRVELLGAGEQVLWRAHGLKSRRARGGGRAILVQLPVTLLHHAEYTLVLSADEADATPTAEFSFAIRRE